VILLGIYPKECKLGYNRDTCTLIFIAALFTIAKLWKQQRCPTNDEWNTFQFYSTIRKNKTTWLEGKWILLEDIMLSELSQG
jgi:hypothetical protein